MGVTRRTWRRSQRQNGRRGCPSSTSTRDAGQTIGHVECWSLYERSRPRYAHFHSYHLTPTINIQAATIMEHTRFLPATTPTRALLRRLRNRSSLVPSISSNFPLGSPPPPASTSTKTSSMAPATRSATKTATRGTKTRPATSTGNESPCVERQQRGGGGGGAAGPRLTWEAARKLESEFEAQEKVSVGKGA